MLKETKRVKGRKAKIGKREIDCKERKKERKKQKQAG